jgi:hypothetical protein
MKLVYLYGKERSRRLKIFSLFAAHKIIGLRKGVWFKNEIMYCFDSMQGLRTPHGG